MKATGDIKQREFELLLVYDWKSSILLYRDFLQSGYVFMCRSLGKICGITACDSGLFIFIWMHSVWKLDLLTTVMFDFVHCPRYVFAAFGTRLCSVVEIFRPCHNLDCYTPTFSKKIRVQFRMTSREIHSGRTVKGAGFSARSSTSPADHHSTMASYICITSHMQYHNSDPRTL